MVWLGVVLFGTKVFGSKLVHNTRFVKVDKFSIFSLSCITKFTLTGFTIQSFYHPHIIHITIKIIAVIIHLSVSPPQLDMSLWHLWIELKKET